MVEFAGEGGENVDKFSFSVLKGIGKRPAVTIKELAAIYNRSVDYMEDPVLYLRRCGYLDIERNYAALHDLTENSLIGRDTPLTISYGGRIAIYGDYLHYTSKPLRDFIYECNKGEDINRHKRRQP